MGGFALLGAFVQQIATAFPNGGNVCVPDTQAQGDVIGCIPQGDAALTAHNFGTAVAPGEVAVHHFPGQDGVGPEEGGDRFADDFQQAAGNMVDEMDQGFGQHADS